MRAIARNLHFMGNPAYVPILNWRTGEMIALRELSPTAHQSLIPLIDMTEDTIDDDEPADADVSGKGLFCRAVEALRKARGTHYAYVDTTSLDSALGTATGVHPVQRFFDVARAKGVRPIPVVTLDAPSGAVAAAAAAIAVDGRGACLRVYAADVLSNTFSSDVGQVLSALSLTPKDVDFLLDWESIEPDAAAQTALTVRAVLTSVPSLLSWRSVIFAASAFPQMLSGTGRLTIPRTEWHVFKQLLGLAPGGRQLSFGDYAVAFPTKETVRFMGAAAVRYTDDDEWIIYRGRSLKGPVHGGFSQFRTLCQALAADPAFRGAAFSWGDAQIAQCGGQQGSSTGNLTTWRAVGTNHHLTLVGQQTASFRAPSTGAAPHRVGP